MNDALSYKNAIPHIGRNKTSDHILTVRYCSSKITKYEEKNQESSNKRILEDAIIMRNSIINDLLLEIELYSAKVEKRSWKTSFSEMERCRPWQKNISKQMSFISKYVLLLNSEPVKQGLKAVGL